MRILSRCAALAAVVLGLVVDARASITLYSSESAYAAATTGLTTIDFNGIAPSNSFVSYGSGPLALSGVTFTSNASMFIIDPGYYGSSYAGGGFLTADYASPTDNILATLPGAYTAIGMNFGGLFSGGTVDFMFTLSDGSTYSASTTQSIGGDTLDFIGVTSTVAIASVSISMPDASLYNAIDNFSFGASAVPEMSTLCSTGFGALLCFGYARLRRRKV